MKKVYLVGSLRNPSIQDVATQLRTTGHLIFDDWYAAGPTADDCWKDYEMARGRSYTEALGGYAAQHVFAFDKHHLDTSDAGVLVMPAGKSGHLELGYLAGQGKPVAILLDSTVERWDVMVQFAKVFTDVASVITWLQELR